MSGAQFVPVGIPTTLLINHAFELYIYTEPQKKRYKVVYCIIL